MTPPEAPVATRKPDAMMAPPAVGVCVTTLKRRPDFLLAARARRQGATGFHLQARRRDGDDATPGGIRVGITCSKKVGNAVARNRAKRRLRAVAARVLPVHGRAGWDYVLIGRAGVSATRPFASLVADLEQALARLHGA